MLQLASLEKLDWKASGVAPEAALYYDDPVRVHPSAVVIFENVKALEYEVPNETQHKIATSTQATWGPVCF